MIDLHMHTVYSDGTNTVEEILKMAEDLKLKYISITDHDNCKQYEDEAIKQNKIFKGKIIKGTELHAIFNKKCIEILAYNIDTEIINKWLEKYYSEAKLRENQVLSREKMFKIFDKHGIIYDKSKITMPDKPTDFVERIVYFEALNHKENIEKLGEFAKAFGLLYRKGLTNPESTFFMDTSDCYPQYKEVIDIIHRAGGKAFLAHAFEYKFEDTIKFIDDLRKESELDGIECYHPSSEDDGKIDILINYARKNNLLISGGSDYHGTRKPNINIGIGKGTLNIPEEILKEWI